MGRKSESGQLMIMVALSMVVFLGMAALAIDLGRGYSERRSAQNAADAAALAGMRLIATQPSTPVATLYQVMSDVARANGGAELLPEAQGGAVLLDQSKNFLWNVSPTSAIPQGYPGAIYLKVKTRIQYKSFFAGFIGVSQMASGGAASAMLQGTGLGNLLPLAFHINGQCGVTPNYGYDTPPSPPNWTIYDYTNNWWAFFSSTAVNGPGGFGYLDFTGAGNTTAETTADWVLHGFNGDYLTWKNYKWDDSMGYAGSPTYGAWGWDSTNSWYTKTTPLYRVDECNGWFADGTGGSFDWTNPGNKPGSKTPPTWGSPPPNMPAGGDWKLVQASGMDTPYTQTTHTPNNPPTISWMAGNSGLSNANVLANAMESMRGRDVMVMVYNKYSASGSNIRFQIIGWAGFHIYDIDMHSNPKYIKGTFQTAIVPGTPSGTPCARDIEHPCTARLVPNI